MDWAFAPKTAIDWVRAVCLWIQVAIAAWVLRCAGWLAMPFRGRQSMNTMGLSNVNIRKFRYLAAVVILADIAAVAVIAADWAIPVDLILWAISLFMIVRQFRNLKKSRPKFDPVRFKAYALGPLGAAGLAGLGLLVSTVYHGAPMRAESPGPPAASRIRKFQWQHKASLRRSAKLCPRLPIFG